MRSKTCFFVLSFLALLSGRSLGQEKGFIIIPHLRISYSWLPGEIDATRYLPSVPDTIWYVGTAVKGSQTQFGIDLGYMIKPGLGILTGFSIQTSHHSYKMRDRDPPVDKSMELSLRQTAYTIPLQLRYVRISGQRLNFFGQTGLDLLLLHRIRDRSTTNVYGTVSEYQGNEDSSYFRRINLSAFIYCGAAYRAGPGLIIQAGPELSTNLLGIYEKEFFSQSCSLGIRIGAAWSPFLKKEHDGNNTTRSNKGRKR